jgi:hypothetical protein
MSKNNVEPVLPVERRLKRWGLGRQPFASMCLEHAENGEMKN